MDGRVLGIPVRSGPGGRDSYEGMVLAERDESTYLPTCLLRSAESFAVQGLMMLSEGDTYCAGCLQPHDHR